MYTMASPQINVDISTTSSDSSPDRNELPFSSPIVQDFSQPIYDPVLGNHVYGDLAGGEVRTSYYNLTPLEARVVESISPPPSGYSALYPVLSVSEHLMNGVPPVTEEALSEERLSDFCNLSMITPTLYPMKVEDTCSPTYGSSSSSSSNTPSPASTWMPLGEYTTEVNNTASPMNGHRLSESMLDPKQCAKCGDETCREFFLDSTGHFLCHVCRIQVHNTTAMEPNARSRAKPQKRSSTKKNTNSMCTNCKTTLTALWRRNPDGEIVCNACGLYFKLHKSNRPVTMRKDSIQKRKRKPKSPENRRRSQSTAPTCNLPTKEVSYASTVNASSYDSQLLSNRSGLMQTNGNGVHHHHNHHHPHQPLPAVHSVEGFQHLTGSPFAGQGGFPQGYPNQTVSPTITSLLQANHHFQSHYNEGFHHLETPSPEESHDEILIQHRHN